MQNRGLRRALLVGRREAQVWRRRCLGHSKSGDTLSRRLGRSAVTTTRCQISYHTDDLLLHTLVDVACLRSPSRSSDKTGPSAIPCFSASYCSSRHVASHRSMRAEMIGEGLNSTNFCRSGSVKKEISWPGGSIMPSFSTKPSALSMPSSVTEVCPTRSMSMNSLWSYWSLPRWRGTYAHRE